jgi:outer membrane receptor protein involved in Fe transport
LDQTKVELPAQYFDIDFLTSDSCTLRYTCENSTWFRRVSVDSWWNSSRFEGNQQKLTKPGVLAIFGPLSFLADNGNVGEVASTGARAAATWGETDAPQLTAGSDLSYVEQEYYETADGSGISGNNYYGRFGLPRSQVTTPGLFVDYSQPWGERVQLGAGGRLDWISVRAVDSPVFNIGSFFGGLDPKQNYTLPSGYLNGKLHLTHAWTLAAGFGYAERAPTPTDLYAKTFLEVLQPGAVTDFRGSLVGTTPVRLAPEKVRHLDLSLELKQDFIRGGLHGFHAWIEDFVTYRGSLTQFQTVNTNATLVGAEATGEVDVAPRWVVFGSLGYVRGQDLVLDEPLWGVPPMDTRLGFRLHALPADTPFGVEWAARIVDRQDRVATKMFGTSWAQEQPTPAFTTYDVRGYCQLTRTVQLLAGIENLTNKFYQEHLDARNDLSHASPGGVFRRGRTFYIGFDAAY